MYSVCMAEKVSIIIVSYNVRNLLTECIDSVRKALEGLDGQIVVVDNCSKDDTVDYLSKHYPDVKLIVNEENVGFAKANNQAIKACTSEYVLLLNPDTVVGEQTILKCIEFMDAHPEAGGAGVRRRSMYSSRLNVGFSAVV